jgi:hypothetical protein
MPTAVPGSAEVQVMLKDRKVNDPVEVWVREIPPEGEQQAPPWSPATAIDQSLFSKPLPLMVLGVWRAQIRVKGSRGEGTIGMPVSARVAAPKAMNMRIAVALVGLFGLLYSSGYQLLVGLGSATEQEASQGAIRRGRIYAAIGLTVLSGYVSILAYVWYLAHVNTRSVSVPPLTSELGSISPTMMELRIKDSDERPLVDLQPDHGKMMHMVVVEMPGAARFFHLHPRRVGPGRFQFATPPPGNYKLFADVCRSSGEGETVTTNLDVDAAGGSTSFEDPDDSASTQPAFGALPAEAMTYSVGDGLKITWKNSARSINKCDLQKLTFELSDDRRRPLPLEPYMGMDGHLLIMRSDANVFAHVHPMGTLPGMMPMHDMANMSKTDVSFPYGFPDRGLYRLWVQVKYQGRVRTGVVDVRVN